MLQNMQNEAAALIKFSKDYCSADLIVITIEVLFV